MENQQWLAVFTLNLPFLHRLNFCKFWKSLVFFFSSVYLCIKVTWSVIHWTWHSWSAFCIYGDLHVSLALGSVYQVNHQNGVSENKMFWSTRKHQTDFLGLNQNEEEQIWKIFPLPFWFPPEEIRQNSLYVNNTC